MLQVVNHVYIPDASAWVQIPKKYFGRLYLPILRLVYKDTPQDLSKHSCKVVWFSIVR